MCGISGSIDFSGNHKPLDKEVHASLLAMAHRGPDDSGIAYFPEGVLAHVRLGILDPGPGSHQPFSSEDGRYHLVYNGEIFNFQDLRSELEKLGVHFKTSGDTEVLLQYLIKYGVNCLQQFNGFFAFAFYDQVDKKLLIARDRMGIKPLFYYIEEQRLTFASEMQGLLPYKTTSALDLAGIELYFKFGYVPAPQSVIKDVRRLRPGFFISCENGQIKEEQYYKPENWTTHKNAQLTDLLEDAVKIRLIADRPLGCFLSGGIDSSIVAALAAKQVAGLKTFSLSFPEFGYLDEGDAARKVAQHIGSEHRSFEVTLENLRSELPEFLRKIDAPFADSSAFAVWLLSKKTSEYVKVVLSGDGADELFAGYRKHRAALMFQNPMLKTLFSLLPPTHGNREGKLADLRRKIGRLAHLSSLSEDDRLLALASFADEEHLSHLFKSPAEPIRLSNESAWKNLPSDWMQKVLEFDRQIVLPDDMLYKTDSASMAHGLELRCPFLDYRVVSLARSLPTEALLHYKQGKLPLRKAFSHLLPEDVFSRPKKGFEIPLASLMRDLPKEWDYRFERDYIESQGIFNWSAVTKLAKAEYKNAFDQWAYLIFQAWYLRTFKKG